MPKRSRSSALLAALALVAAGCGGAVGAADRPTTTAATARAPAAAQSGASALEQAFVRVVRTVGPSVVQIESGGGLGSGIVLDGRGHIVTNAHVVGSATRFRVTLSNGDRREARLVAAFPPDDLAVVRASGDGFRPARLADSSRLRVGDIVLAVGNPLGLRSSVTQGIVSGLGRTVSEPNGAALPNAIQTSAAINPGNSGGALVDLDARVVGIPTLAARDPQLGSGAAPGIGFAIPSNRVRDLAMQMVRHGRVVNSHRAFLGVRLGEDLASAGAVVAAVEPGTPAARAGIVAGDVILAIGGRPTPGPAEVAAALATHDPGQTVNVRVRHQSGRTAVLRVRLGELPAGG